MRVQPSLGLREKHFDWPPKYLLLPHDFILGQKQPKRICNSIRARMPAETNATRAGRWIECVFFDA